MKSSIELNSENFAYSNKKNQNSTQVEYKRENEVNPYFKPPTTNDMPCVFSLGVSNSSMIIKENQSPVFIDYSNANNFQTPQPPMLNHTTNYAYSMPQLSTNTLPVYNPNGQYHSMTSDNLKMSNFPTYYTQSDSSSASFSCLSLTNDKNDQNNEGMSIIILN
jgi:hypothetical protein